MAHSFVSRSPLGIVLFVAATALLILHGLLLSIASIVRISVSLCALFLQV